MHFGYEEKVVLIVRFLGGLLIEEINFDNQIVILDRISNYLSLADLKSLASTSNFIQNIARVLLEKHWF